MSRPAPAAPPRPAFSGKNAEAEQNVGRRVDVSHGGPPGQHHTVAAVSACGVVMMVRCAGAHAQPSSRASRSAWPVARISA